MIRRHINTGPVPGGMSRRPHAFRRAGFTLVEILVVLTIIILLASLILAAVLRTLEVGTRTENFSEIAQIESAIGEAKQKLNLPQIPPGPFNLKNIYNQNDPELGYLLQAWPQLNWTTWAPPAQPGTGLIPISQNGTATSVVTLDSNQTLLFFLTGGTVTNFTGFSTNSAQPFTVANTGDNRKGPFLQRSTKYFSTLTKLQVPASASGLVLLSTTSAVQVYSTTSPNGVLFPVTVTVATQNPPHAWLIDPYGLPYAYFAAISGKTNLYCPPPMAQNATSPTVTLNTLISQSYQLNFGSKFSPLGGANLLTPYMSNPSTLTYFNPQGNQIISSGKDGIFGPGGALGATLPPSTAEGYDDQANFTKVTLCGGIQ